MKRIYCDKCGEELTENSALKMKMEYMVGTLAKDTMEYELCEDCVRKVMRYIEDGTNAKE